MTQPTLIIHDLSNAGLFLRTSADEQFQGALNEQRDKSADVLLPYSVAIDNTTGLDLIAYVVTFKFASGDKNPYSITAVKDDYREFRALCAHSARLVPILRGMNMTNFRLNADRLRDLLILMNAQECQLNIKLDAAVFSDGSTVGPEAWLWGPRVKARIEAEHDLRDIVLDLGGTSNLRAKLAELTNQAYDLLPSDQPRNVGALSHAARHSESYSNMYTFQTGTLASNFLGSLDDNGQDALVESISRHLSAKPYPVIHQ